MWLPRKISHRSKGGLIPSHKITSGHLAHCSSSQVRLLSLQGLVPFTVTVQADIRLCTTKRTSTQWANQVIGDKMMERFLFRMLITTKAINNSIKPPPHCGSKIGTAVRDNPNQGKTSVHSQCLSTGLARSGDSCSLLSGAKIRPYFMSDSIKSEWFGLSAAP